MSVYQPLADFLARHKGDRWDASFVDIQDILHRPLPRSAYRHQAWWANQSGDGHSQTHGWRSVGWKTTRLDLERRQVTFERDRRGSAVTSIDASFDSTDKLFDQASQLTGIADRDQLIAAALQALIAHEGVRHLSALGGAMPDYAPPDRERP